MAETHEDTMPRRYWLWGLAGVFALALLVRVATLAWVNYTPSYTTLSLSSDGLQYDLLAKSLLQGDWAFENGYFASRPPLLPILVAGLYSLFGTNPELIVWLNVILGTLTAVIAVLATMALLDRPRWALLAGAIVAIDPASVVNNLNWQAETLTNFMLALMLWAVAVAWQRDWRWLSLLAGLCLTLANLSRPTTVYLPVFALLAVALLMWLENRPRLWQHLLVFALLPILGVYGWGLRNQAHLGINTYSTVSSFNLLFYRAVSVERWSDPARPDPAAIRIDFATALEERLGTPAEALGEIDEAYFWRYFNGESAAHIREMQAMAVEVYRAHPLTYVALVGPGLARMYASTDLLRDQGLLAAELLWHALFYGAALAGAVWLYRERQWLALVLPLMLIGYVSAVTMVSQTSGLDTRMRTSVTVGLAVLAAPGLAWLWTWLGGKLTALRKRRHRASP